MASGRPSSDRQIEPMLRSCSGVGSKPGCAARAALDEQLRRVGVGPGSVRIGNGQWSERIDELPGHSEWQPAGGEDRGVRARRQQSDDEADHLGEEVLAVVENQQRASLMQDPSDGGEGVVVTLDADGGGDALCHLAIVLGCELDEPHIVGGVILDCPAGHLESKAGLACSTGGDDGHQPVVGQPGEESLDVGRTPDEARERLGEQGRGGDRGTRSSQDLLLDRPQLGSGFEPRFGQSAAGVVDRPEGLALAPETGACSCEQLPRSFAKWVCCCESFRADQCHLKLTRLDECFDAGLVDGRSSGRDLRTRRHREVVEAQVVERFAIAERPRSRRELDHIVPFALATVRGDAVGELDELPGVDLDGDRRERVTVALGDDRSLREVPAQRRDVRLECTLGPRWGFVVPEPIDQRFGRQAVVTLAGEDREKATLGVTRDVDVMAVNADARGPEDCDLRAAHRRRLGRSGSTIGRRPPVR